MKLGSKPPRTPCSILSNLSSVTRARGTRAQCTNAGQVSGKSCNPGDLTFWEEPGRQLQFAVEGEEAVGMDGGVHQFTSRQGAKHGKSDLASETRISRNIFLNYSGLSWPKKGQAWGF